MGYRSISERPFPDPTGGRSEIARYLNSLRIGCLNQSFDVPVGESEALT